MDKFIMDLLVAFQITIVPILDGMTFLILYVMYRNTKLWLSIPSELNQIKFDSEFH